MGDLLLPAYVPYLKRAVKFIGFKSSLIPEHIRDRKEKADPSENAKGKRFSFGKFSIPDGNYPPPPCGVSHVEFQLMFMGSLLSRDVDSKPDPRVRGFFPDAWQRKVLDVIDRRESMLVCAPTSSGKTFIAYYAAEQVLRSSDDHVLVYVAPTKALVNQVIADLTARFSKQYKHSGKTMVGLYTRDYKFRAMSSQILVTVPQMLEILLLSPEHSQQWAPRIDWIVFDEIHCMGEMSQGPVWEHLMMISARIPIVALSATIGNTDKFHKWLSLMKAQSGKPLHLIQHHSRYNDLRTFTYTPNFRKAVDSEFKSSPSPFSHIHPIAALSVVSSSALAMIPPDLSLEPMDCFTLFHAISSLDPENDELNQLEPNSFFKNITPTSPPFLRRADVRLWERELMRIMEQWASIDGGPKNAGSRMERLVDLLQRDTKTKITTMEAEWKESELSHSEQPKNRSSPYGSAFNEKCVYDLVTDLRREGMAPALMFMYDRTGCDKLAIKLLSKLEDEEREYKTTAEYRIKLEDYEQHMADVKRAMEAFEKEQQSKRKVKVARTDEDAGPSVIQSPTLPQLPKHLDGFNPNRPDPRFTFADYRSSQYEVVQKEIDAMIYKMKRNAALNPVDLTLLRALARGIGVHHAGKNRKFRQLVEILFRQQYLTVVFATGTLSLGINMPCRTVVHVGDSVFLTALNYRQTSGRAGRRGFDNLGNVVFFGIPLQKAHRLMSSSLPELRGGFPLTVSFVSRLVQLVKASQSGCHASPVLENLLGMSSEDKSQNLGTHASRNVRSALLYLQRSGLISSNEMPVGLCGLANHLFYTEPANIAFAALFNAGVFVGLARRFREDEPSSSANTSVLLEVMEILGHLFDRINLPKSFGASRNWVRRTRTSKIILPPLPEECQRILTEHNQLVLNTYVDFWLNEIASSDGEPENDLPLSHISIPLYHSTTIAPPPFVLRSPFVALSGYADDQYRSINELIQTSRSDVRIDPEAIPSMSPFLESSCTVNAYIVDFFRHGQLQPLTEENGIRTGDVWERLNDFFLILKTIRCSLQILMLRGSSKHEDFVPDEDRNSGGAGEDVDGDSTLVQNSEGSERLTDREDDESEVDKEILPPLRSRPQVADELWHVYSLFLELERRFGQKFKAVWA
ncbi:hypothetical protein BJ742DRAFT_677787 [Cladochytrium replicatum]|nr:hypothetical protein BJ742DRAFT_677787 [Cladochytrium replicatum]